MGFMDKAKKMAEQAQAKLDEAQQSFNERQGQSAPGDAAQPPVQYDQHGRPVPAHSDPIEESATPPHGDPLAPQEPAAPAPPGPHEEPAAESTTPPHGDPLAADAPRPKAPPAGHRPADTAHPPGPSPGMTSGDPLAG